MGLFNRSPRDTRHTRTSAATDTTMTDGGYDNRVHDGHHNHGLSQGAHYDRTTPGLSHGTHHDRSTHMGTHGDYNDGVNNGVTRGDYDNGVDRSHNTGRRGRGFGRNRIGRNNEKGHRSRTPRDKRPLFDIHSGYYNRRPSFGTWLKYTWLDIVTMIAMGAVGLGVYEADPAPSRSFPITFVNGSVVYPQFAYPLRNEIVPIWLAALLASIIPIFIFLVMQIRIKSFWDVNNAVIGLLYSLIGAAVFQVFVKWLIGGLRPHFLDVCAPDLNRVAQAGGEGFASIMFKPDICTGDRNQINDSLESMPSGHSTAAFAGFIFLYLYLNAKLKVFSNHHPAMWKLIVLYAPVLGATLIAGALTIDEFHNWYDCLAGAIIGTVFAFSAYRMVYASVWDFRFNHIPLTRHTPFSYGAGSAGAGGFESAVFTHQAGWGYEEAYGGAPFDSAFALRGMNGGVTSGPGQTVGLNDKHMGHRHGDIEHNAVGAGTGTTGVLGHNRDHNYGTGHHSTLGGHRDGTYNTGNTYNTTSGLTSGTHHHHTPGVTNPTSSTTYSSSGVTHPNITHESHIPGRGDHLTSNRDGGLTHNDGLTHHDDLDREGRSTMVGDNRYKSHRKSLERKALAAQTRNDNTTTY